MNIIVVSNKSDPEVFGVSNYQAFHRYIVALVYGLYTMRLPIVQSRSGEYAPPKYFDIGIGIHDQGTIYPCTILKINVLYILGNLKDPNVVNALLEIQSGSF